MTVNLKPPPSQSVLLDDPTQSRGFIVIIICIFCPVVPAGRPITT